MASTFLNDKKVRTIHLGSTYKRKRQTTLHTLRYDFKPASVDLSQTGKIEVGENNEVAVTLPSSNKKGHTVYKGSKKPALKECVLIYDPATDEFTLEKVTSQCQVKKTRPSSSQKVPPSLPQSHPNLPKLNSKKNPAKKPSNSNKTKQLAQQQSQQALQQQQGLQQQAPPHAGRKQELVQEERNDRARSISPIQQMPMQVESPSFGNNTIGSRLSSSGEDSSSGSSSSGSSSEDEGDDSPHPPANKMMHHHQTSSSQNMKSRSPPMRSVLDDLELTSSGSDSD